jgi:NTP pyrophosphatase (non-canonical NTP hydrolase)
LSTYKVLQEVYVERTKQDNQWGEQNHHPIKWLAILGEEVGEANHAVLEHDRHNYREELIQVAAVAAAMVESFDRGNW